MDTFCLVSIAVKLMRVKYYFVWIKATTCQFDLLVGETLCEDMRTNCSSDKLKVDNNWLYRTKWFIRDFISCHSERLWLVDCFNPQHLLHAQQIIYKNVAWSMVVNSRLTPVWCYQHITLFHLCPSFKRVLLYAMNTINSTLVVGAQFLRCLVLIVY